MLSNLVSDIPVTAALEFLAMWRNSPIFGRRLLLLRWMKCTLFLVNTSNLWSFIWYLLAGPAFKLILPDKINNIFRYKKLFLFFILLRENSLKFVSKKSSLIFLVICMQKIVFRTGFEALVKISTSVRKAEHIQCYT